MAECPNCGAPADPESAFCDQCGTTLPHAASKKPSQSEPPDPKPTASKPSRSKRARRALIARLGLDQRRRRLTVAAISVWTLAAIALGVAGGYELFNRYATHSRPDVVVHVQQAAAQARPSATVMPDLTGLTHTAALEALADAGIDPSKLHDSTRPSAASPDTVVSQTPVRGTHHPRHLSVVLAAPTTVPDLRGKSTEAATAVLNALDAQVTTLQTYEPNTPVGQVISTDPAPGAQLPLEVTLHVSAAPSAVFLTDISASSSDCETSSDTKVAGKQADHALTCTASTDPLSPNGAQYAVEGLVQAFDATVGVSDTSKPGSTIHIDVVGDGRVLVSVDVKFGQTKPIQVSIVRVLQLEIRVTGSDGADGVLVDPRLIGSPTGITQLASATP